VVTYFISRRKTERNTLLVYSACNYMLGWPRALTNNLNTKIANLTANNNSMSGKLNMNQNRTAVDYKNA